MNRKIIIGATAIVLGASIIGTGLTFAQGGFSNFVKQSANHISSEEAKKSVIQYTGISDIVFQSVELDFENGKWVYDIDARKDNTKYDFHIDAATGAIRSSSIETEETNVNTFGTTQNGDTPVLDTEKIKEIALQKIGKTDVEYSRFVLEYGDDYGTQIYDVDAFDANKEYDLDIHAYTGEILKYEVEEKMAPTQAQTQAPTQGQLQPQTKASTQAQAATQVATQAPTQAPTQAATQAPTQVPTRAATQAQTQAASSNLISKERAKSIAQANVGQDLVFESIELSRDDDYNYAYVYEIEARSGAVEYDIDIDATNGAVLRVKADD